MAKIDDLKEQYVRGNLSRRQFVKGAVALGMSTTAAVGLLRQASANSTTASDHWTIGISVFPIAAKEPTSVGLPASRPYRWDGVRWNPNRPGDMLNYAARRFQKAIELDPDFARGYGGLAYACAIAHAEGWQFKRKFDKGLKLHEDQNRPKVLLNKAKNFAADAVQKGPDDYDNHWSKAIVHMYRSGEAGTDEWSDALSHYQTAERLITEASSAPLADFYFEMADFWTHYGDHAKADTYCMKASPSKEWHNHQKAFCEFAGARNDSARYKRAMDALDLITSGKWDADAPTPTPNERRLAIADLLWATCDFHMKRIGDTSTRPDKRRRGRKRFKQHPHFKAWRRANRNGERYAPFRLSEDQKHWRDAVNSVIS